MLRPLIQPRLKQVLAQRVSSRLSVLATGGLKRGQIAIPEGATFYAPLASNTKDALGAVDTFERASDGLYLDSGGTWRVAGTDVPRFESGKLSMEPAATNVFWNSDAAVTQSVSLPLGNHTFSVHGSGSVVSSDNGGTATGHGTATDGSPVTIDVTAAGLILFTISGSPDYAQVESGEAATSPIITGDSAASRAVDVLTYAGSTGFMNNAEGMVILDCTLLFSNADIPLNTFHGLLFFVPSVSGFLYLRFTAGSTLQLSSYDGATVAAVSFASVAGQEYLFATRWTTGGRQVGVKMAGSWVWSGSATYTGAFSNDDSMLVWYQPVLPIRMGEIVFYNEDRGRAWIEENY